MEHDIGCKIKAARIEKKLTQEQVAELLGVSRQTISNWENEKSYPDIISVIKMSECYDVSLDYLLKGEQKMKSYYDYLEESTNVVKSNANRNKIITILSYLLIWAFAMIVFWFFTSGSDAMGYSLMFLWFILPISTFIVSIVIGKNNFWGKGKWAFTLFFGVMYMLAEYGTFKMANNIAFNKLNAPDLEMIVAGAIISAIGMLVGSLILMLGICLAIAGGCMSLGNLRLQRLGLKFSFGGSLAEIVGVVFCYISYNMIQNSENVKRVKPVFPNGMILYAVFAIILSFIPKFSSVISTMPTAIIGGISFMLYGMISAIGVRNVVENKVDLTKSRNLIIAGVIFVCGLGFGDGLTFTIGGTSITLTALAIAAIAGILLNAILPGNDYEFGKNPAGDSSRGVYVMNTDSDEEKSEEAE